MNHGCFNRILVVDDSTANLQLLVNLLTEQGYTVYPASDGELALEFVQSTLPDLILLDIKMPGMNGFEVCQRLKADDRSASIPVIFLSALEDEHDKVKAFQAGGVDYITKPFQQAEMLARVRIHLRMRELTEGLEQEVDLRTKELTLANKRLEEEIAERKQIEDELRKLNNDFVILLENTGDFIYFKDSDNRFLFCSQTLANITGHKSWRDMIGKDDFDVFPEEMARIYREEEQVILNEGKALLNKVDPYFDAQGGRRWVNTNKWPVFDDKEVVVGIFGISRDITEQKQAEEELVQYKEHLEETVEQRTEELRLARDAAEAANKAKSVFLANMSHELRTPLNAILGFTQLMRQDHSLGSNQWENLEIINNSGDHLLRLINDVLEIAKIEAGKLQLEITSFNLHELVQEVSDMMRLKAQQKGLQLEQDQSSDFPRFIKGDEARLRQILVNLVSNAVKFTEQGGVTIRLSTKRNAVYHLLIEVEDTGPGISSVDQQRLFKPFEQLSLDSSQGGTGLGLAIVKQFVQLMSGNISVESELGQGSLFRVDLPLEAADNAEIPSLVERNYGEVLGLAPGQPHYRILIAENQHENQLLLTKLMTDLGLEVKVAQNGAECVELFEQWKPDLIWMDWRMPVMDGDEATQQIRYLPGGDQVKIVIVTASALKEQEAMLRASGIDDYLSKPYRLDEIYHILEKHLGLTWIYAEAENVRKAPVVAPPSEQLHKLYQLADLGEIFEIKALLSRLEAENEAYIPFVQQIQKLVKRFDIEAITAFLKPYLK
jgi:PAS domain S-box-containing protein